MISVSHVFVGLLGVATAQTDLDRCMVGMTFSGLSANLDAADFMDGGSEYQALLDDGILLFLSYTWTDPDYLGGGAARYGCDRYSCSDEDRALASNKWAIIQRTNYNFAASVLAVCDEGCPDFKPTCEDIYNQAARPEEERSHCPIWLANYSGSPMTWRVLQAASGDSWTTATGVTMNCCERKAQECDACSTDSTCSSLIGLTHNNCPPNEGSWLHPQSDLQKHCCEEHIVAPWDTHACMCKSPEDACDRGAADATEVVV